MIRLSEIADISAGQSAPQDKDAFTSEGGKPFVRAGSLEFLTRGVSEDACEFIRDEAARKYRLKLYPKDAILFAKSGMSATMGRVHRLKKAAYAVSHLAIIIPGENVVPSYLEHYFRAHPPSGLIKDPAYPSIRTSEIEDIKIHLPSLDEQKRIAAILDKADAICRNRAESIRILDELLGAVFLDMFGDPVNNPLDWPTKELGDVCDVQLGKMLSSKAKTGVNSKKYLRNANVRWRHIDFSDVLEMDFSPTEQKKFSLKNGDLLVCEGGEVGRCAIWNNGDSEYYYQKALHRIRVNKKVISSEYLQEYLYWTARLGGLIKASSEVTFSHLTAEKIKTLSIPLPSIKLQEKFVESYNRIQAIRKKYNFLLEQNINLFQSIVQRAFNGKL